MKTKFKKQDITEKGMTVTEYAQKMTNDYDRSNLRMQRFKQVLNATDDFELASAFLRYMQEQESYGNDIFNTKQEKVIDEPEVLMNPYEAKLLQEEPLTCKEINRNRKQFYQSYYRELHPNQGILASLLGYKVCYIANCWSNKINFAGLSLLQHRINGTSKMIERITSGLETPLIPSTMFRRIEKDPKLEKELIYKRKLLTKRLMMLQYFR